MSERSESLSSEESAGDTAAAAAVAETADNDTSPLKPTREEIELWNEISSLIDRNERGELTFGLRDEMLDHFGSRVRAAPMTGDG